jgi:hypothetical protein
VPRGALVERGPGASARPRVATDRRARLDHDLVGDDTIWPVVRLLEDASLAGRPFDVGTVHVHASRSGPAHNMLVSLRRAGYTASRPSDPRVFTW